MTSHQGLLFFEGATANNFTSSLLVLPKNMQGLLIMIMALVLWYPYPYWNSEKRYFVVMMMQGDNLE